MPQDDTPSQARIPRGARSLSGRLVLLLLVPLLAAQGLTGASLLDRDEAAGAARDLARRIDLVAEVGAMFAPVALETAASLGMAEVDRLGVDRAIVTQVLGVDYDPYITGSRAQVDTGLDHLVADHSDVMLPSGRLVRDRVAEVRGPLAAMRTRLDARLATVDEVSSAMDGVSELVAEITHLSRDLHDDTSIDPELGTIGDHVTHLLTLVDAVAVDTTTTSLALGASDGSLRSTDVLLAAGAADFVIAEYREEIGPDDAADFDEAAIAIDTYLGLRPALVTVAAIRTEPRSDTDPNLLFTDPQLIQSLASILVAGFERLEAVGNYTRLELERSLVVAQRIAADADEDVRVWTGAILVMTMASVGLLILVVTSTVRPLSRLTARALQLSEGRLDPRPLPLSGPSDVRAVTATFNTMTEVLSAYESKIRRVSSGEDLRSVDTDLVPGVLGESLRAQIDHLSDMTGRLRESEALARAIIETAADAIWTVDRRGRVLTVNAAGERIMELPAGAQMGRSLFTLLGAPASFERLAGELSLERADGTSVEVLVSHSEVATAKGPIHAVFARAISDRKRFEQQLAHQARHDGLTDLPNRLAALEHLERAARRAERQHSSVAVLFVDLDGFKSVNDSRGHASGDRLLHEVGQRLARTLRSTEFVARLGGDEFLVVCDAMPVDAAAALGERIIREIAQPYVNGDDLFTISASVGVAIASGLEHIDALELIREADVAVYHAKERGRARVVVFDASLQEAVEATAEIELALRQAISDGELVLHYQPVLDLQSGRPWGVEALVRWDRPGHGVLGPDRFIPVAERSALVIELGRWVLEDACRTLAAWQRDPARRHLHCAVNVSGRHLVEGNLIADLDDVLARTGADPRGLEVELTETHLLADFERANQVLTQLRQRGVTVAVDDFGTGYSSMGYLRQLEIDTLKIDRMFVARVNDVGYDRTIVEVLVQLGLTLGLDIVAEGVETVEQLEFMRSRQCTRAQGYHIARPMPLDALDSWLSSSTATSATGATSTAAAPATSS